MQQLGLFETAPETRAPAKPSTAMLLAMETDYQFGKQATPEQAETMLKSLNQMTRDAFDMQNVPGQETAKRAIEIALAGNHRLALIYEGQMPLLLAASWELREQCVASAQINHIDEFDTRNPCQMAVTLDDDAHPPAGYESSATIARRVRSAIHQRLKSNITTDSKADDFLRQLEQHWAFDIGAMQNVREIATTIAHLAGCDYIGRIHVAEAASYCPERPAT